MFISEKQKKIGFFQLCHKGICGLLGLSLLFSTITVEAQGVEAFLNLPAPGTMISPGLRFTPASLKGMTLYPENPLKLDFIIDAGDSNQEKKVLHQETENLVKYFLAALTVPEKELWVNLSPYEKNRIIPDSLGSTAMGRDLLAQDYLLKQIASSLIYPESILGAKFWEKVYQKIFNEYGLTDLPTETFNKVWIVPHEAVLYEQNNSVFMLHGSLKVMMDQDYLALQKNLGKQSVPAKGEKSQISQLTSELLGSTIIPEIEKEVNYGENFSKLRQIYSALVLAMWYKENLRESFLGQVYMDQNKTQGIELKNREVKKDIYRQYLQSVKKGVYDYIKEDYNPSTQEVIPRKYFSGGFYVDSSMLTYRQMGAYAGLFNAKKNNQKIFRR